MLQRLCELLVSILMQTFDHVAIVSRIAINASLDALSLSAFA